jgi:hypothetical protein
MVCASAGASTVRPLVTYHHVKCTTVKEYVACLRDDGKGWGFAISSKKLEVSNDAVQVRSNFTRGDIWKTQPPYRSGGSLAGRKWAKGEKLIQHAHVTCVGQVVPGTSLSPGKSYWVGCGRDDGAGYTAMITTTNLLVFNGKTVAVSE